MAKCGNCKQDGMTVEHVQSCYAQKWGNVTVRTAVTGFAESYIARREAIDFAAVTVFENIPDARYALYRDGVNQIVFYEVYTPSRGTWAGFQFVNRLQGSPGEFKRSKVKGKVRQHILEEISMDPLGSARLYSKAFKRCSVCNAPLSDDKSLARGIGPKCLKAFT